MHKEHVGGTAVYSTITRFFWLVLLAVSAIYLLNPTAGIIELIPDNIPLIGNLDEAGATYLLITALKNLA